MMNTAGGDGRPMHSRYPPGSPPPVARSTISDGFGCLTAVRLTAGAKLTRYFRRLVHYGHMDFEMAAWQMVYLLAKPQQVYRNFMYRKRTKDQYARDDPAFLVLLSGALFFTSLLFTLVIGLTFVHLLKLVLWVVFVDCIGVGIIVATCLWCLSNSFMRRDRSPEQLVEWGYCFDVHLNAFFPLLVMLHVAMPILYLPIIQHAGILPTLIGNTIWFIAVAYYAYITFLGYAAMKNLRHTHIFLYPFTFLFIFYIATVTIGWNISQSCMAFYEYRVVN